MENPNSPIQPESIYQELEHRGVVEETDILKFGLAQDPTGFLNFLDTRLRSLDHETMEKVVQDMLVNRVILPLKRDEIPAKVEEFIQNPVSTLQQEIMKAWDQLKESYLGTPWWVISAIEELKNNPEYVERITQGYKSTDPNIEVVDGMIIRNPVDHMLTDEAVEIFRQSAGKGEKFTKRFAYFNDTPELEEYLQDHIRDIDLSDELRGFENSDQIRDFIMATNNALGYGLNTQEPGEDPGWLKSLRTIPILVEATKTLYKTIDSVLRENWAKNGINYTNEDILQIIDQVIPGWFDWERTGPHTVEDLTALVRERVDILTSPYFPDQGVVVIPTIETVLQYGPGLG